MNRLLRGDHCQCSGPPYQGCGQYFNSTSAFDKHRVGDGEARRCLTAVEMLRKGMALSSRGWWITAARPILTRPVIAGAGFTPDPLGSGPDPGLALPFATRSVTP